MCKRNSLKCVKEMLQQSVVKIEDYVFARGNLGNKFREHLKTFVLDKITLEPN